MPIRVDTTRAARAWVRQRARPAPKLLTDEFDSVLILPVGFRSATRRPCGCEVDVYVFGHTGSGPRGGSHCQFLV